jgi:uncharacterized protein involved in type VI secretion and phage assembly
MHGYTRRHELAREFDVGPSTDQRERNRLRHFRFDPARKLMSTVDRRGEEVWVDKHGRIKVHFYWDRDSNRDEKSSCWIRVATPWGGTGWGSVSIPRIGNEVIVAFEEGTRTARS